MDVGNYREGWKESVHEGREVERCKEREEDIGRRWRKEERAEKGEWAVRDSLGNRGRGRSSGRREG